MIHVAAHRDIKMRRIPLLFVAILFAALFSTACSGINVSPAAPTPYDHYEVDPIFWAYFKQNGGIEQFGPVLSTLFPNPAGEKLQYIESGLMVYNPTENRFYFAPLGVDLNLSEPPDSSQTQPGDLVINRYRIHPALVGFYLELGQEIIGAPISNPNYNYAKNRLEQHFENLGLYYQLDDPSKTPGLLSYGLLACTTCQAYPNSGGGRMQEPISNDQFLLFINSNQIPFDLLGDPVIGPVLLSDNTTEIVFEHMVLSARDGQIFIQAIPQSLGHVASELFAAIESPILTFFPIQGNLGHNVLNDFHAFITAHGGYAISGAPTTELHNVNPETNIIRQCFTNLCLDYYPDALEAPVRPAQLGAEYLNRNAHRFPIDLQTDLKHSGGGTTPRNPEVFTLHVSEGCSTINSSTPQTISVMVFSNDIAQSGQNLELFISLPDGIQQLYYLPTTNNNGRTGITVQPISAENSTLIHYEVCLPIEGQESICIKDSYMIWGNP